MYFTSHEVIDPELTLVYTWFMHAHSKSCGYASSEIANVMQRRTYFGLQGSLIFIAAHGLADIAVAAFEGGVIGGVAAAGAGRRRCALPSPPLLFSSLPLPQVPRAFGVDAGVGFGVVVAAAAAAAVAGRFGGLPGLRLQSSGVAKHKTCQNILAADNVQVTIGLS